jgi:PPOX class probable F420-dependent enzyme
MTLDDTTRQLVDGKNFAIIATMNPDGSPQTSVVWVGLDDDAVVFSSTTTRRKTRNIVRDPRVSLTVLDADNPYHTVEIRGTAEVIDDSKRELSTRLSHKYVGENPPPEPPEVQRVIVRVTADKVIGFSA